MAAFIYSGITKAGLQVLAKGEAGQQIRYTRLVLGDGALEGKSIPDLPGVINPRVTVSISACRVLEGGMVSVSGIFSNGDLDTGFYYRELGLYAQDPDLGEVLYSYGNAGELAEWIPPTGSLTVVEKNIAVITKIGSATNISAYIPDEIYATKEDAARLQEEIDRLAQSVQEINDRIDAIVITLDGKADKSRLVNATLTSGGWAGSATPYTQTVAVQGVTATSANEILPALAITPEQLDKLQAANLQDGGQAAGSITVKAFGDKPDIDLPIRVIVRGDL